MATGVAWVGMGVGYWDVLDSRKGIKYDQATTMKSIVWRVARGK